LYLGPFYLESVSYEFETHPHSAVVVQNLWYVLGDSKTLYLENLSSSYYAPLVVVTAGLYFHQAMSEDFFPSAYVHLFPFTGDRSFP
jgi:hypothetical protein